MAINYSKLTRHTRTSIGQGSQSELISITIYASETGIKDAFRNVSDIVKRATDDRKKDINKLLRKAIRPYEPYDTGALSRRVSITEGGIFYNAYNEKTLFPYPTAMYVNEGGKYTFSRKTHNNATDHWDKVAMSKSSVRRPFLKDCEQILKKQVRSSK